MTYTLYFLFGRYDVCRIDREAGNGNYVLTVMGTGRQETARKRNCYGSFPTSGDARKAAQTVNEIHKKHANRVARALTAHTEAVRARNNETLRYLHEIRSSQLSHTGNPDGPGQSPHGEPDASPARSGRL